MFFQIKFNIFYDDVLKICNKIIISELGNESFNFNIEVGVVLLHIVQVSENARIHRFYLFLILVIFKTTDKRIIKIIYKRIIKKWVEHNIWGLFMRRFD